MPDQIIVRENGTVGINIILKWLASEQARAVKLVIVEGIPNSGKSHLGKVAAKKASIISNVTNYFRTQLITTDRGSIKLLRVAASRN